MSFTQQWQQLSWQEIQLQSHNSSQKQVLQVLSKTSTLSLADLQHLLSPAAAKLLPQLAAKAQQLTRQRFGNTVQLFAPLYLSNLCANECLYCGFSMSQKVRRKILTLQEIELECQAIQAMGIGQVLLVTGEHDNKAGLNYFRHVLPSIRQYFSNVLLEVQPLDTTEYKELRALGADGVMLYQETYHPETYQQQHIKGKKSDILWRLDAPDRLGQAGIEKIGLGILLGLADWRTDAMMLAHHLQYLQKTYWQCRFSLSVPRIRPCSGGSEPAVPVSDKAFLQLICAFRLFMPSLEISLSTRESAYLRNNIIPLAITSASAGSRTQPGGYIVEPENLEQFSIDDKRSPQQLAQALQMQGLYPVWKDWENFLGR